MKPENKGSELFLIEDQKVFENHEKLALYLGCDPEVIRMAMEHKHKDGSYSYRNFHWKRNKLRRQCKHTRCVLIKNRGWAFFSVMEMCHIMHMNQEEVRHALRDPNYRAYGYFLAPISYEEYRSGKYETNPRYMVYNPSKDGYAS